MSLSINNLEKIHESEKITSTTKEIINVFLLAVNDWPNSINDLDDYEEKICKLTGAEVNERNLKEYLRNINFSKEAWESESISQLLEVFKYYEDKKSLKEIIVVLHKLLAEKSDI